MQKIDNLDEIPPISEMKSLMERLDKSTVDRIRSATKPIPKRKQRGGFPNPIFEEARDMLSIPTNIADVLTGAINSVGGRVNYVRIFNLFQSLDYIDTRRVQIITELNERQAQRYVQICRIALPHLIRCIKTSELEPHKTIH